MVMIRRSFGSQMFLMLLSMVAAVPRPGRRASSLAVGMASLLVLVDAVLHPGKIDGLWTLSLVREITDWAEG
jgi:hypothetical protein